MEKADELLRLAADNSIIFADVFGNLFGGWARAMGGYYLDGIAKITKAHDFMKSAGAIGMLPFSLGLFAESHLENDELEKVQAVLNRAFSELKRHRNYMWRAELHRLKGEVLKRSDDRLGEAEECFRKGLDIARGQKAPSLELRASMSLARLWQRQGRRAEAKKLLKPVYDRFTEGFDTKDLIKAKAVLKELGGL